jgi:hypothetical protein
LGAEYPTWCRLAQVIQVTTRPGIEDCFGRILTVQAEQQPIRPALRPAPRLLCKRA